jgi:hypothetical protein
VDNCVIKSSSCNPTIDKFWSLVKLAKNWSDYLLQNTAPPETVAEAVEWLMSVLEDEAKSVIRSMREEDLFNLHFSLGMAIRNAFGLHDPGSKLLASCGVVHPDDASGVIIQALWIKLTRGVHTTTKCNE